MTQWTRTISGRSSLNSILLSGVFVVLTLASAAQAQTFHVIHNFTGGADGAMPFAGLTMDRGGNFFGTTSAGGTGSGCFFDQPGCGVVYKLTHAGQGWILAPIYEFPGTSNNNDGAQPWGRVTFGPDGALYGATLTGGQDGAGTIFRVTPPATACRTAECFWNESILYTFTGAEDGEWPRGDLMFDPQGNLYGTTQNGGIFQDQCGFTSCGTVYELSHSGGLWTETAIYSFTSTVGYLPMAGVVRDSANNLYGTTTEGDDGGIVYQLVPGQNGAWFENTLHNFIPSGFGAPIGGLISDSAGNFYGTTAGGGGPGGGGTVFQLVRSGSNWNFMTLYIFTSFQTSEPGPWTVLTMDSAGNLYGTTYEGGAQGCGTVFKLTNSNGNWSHTSLHDFTCGSDGALPISNVTLDGAGNLWGTTSEGGSAGLGVVWEITP